MMTPATIIYPVRAWVCRASDDFRVLSVAVVDRITNLVCEIRSIEMDDDGRIAMAQLIAEALNDRAKAITAEAVKKLGASP